MKIFKNKQLTESIDPKKLDLEIVEGGDSRTYTFYIQNDHPRGELRELKVLVDNEEIEILKYPRQLGINESGELVFKWNCNAKLEEGISPKFSFTYNIICGPSPL